MNGYSIVQRYISSEIDGKISPSEVPQESMDKYHMFSLIWRSRCQLIAMVSDMENCANQKTGEGVILREGDSDIVKKKNLKKENTVGGKVRWWGKGGETLEWEYERGKFNWCKRNIKQYLDAHWCSRIVTAVVVANYSLNGLRIHIVGHRRSVPSPVRLSNNLSVGTYFFLLINQTAF